MGNINKSVRLAISFLILFICTNAIAQNITGIIVDSSSNLALPSVGLNLFSLKNKFSTKTDSLGQFEFNNIPNDKYSLKIYKNGYNIATEEITINDTSLYLVFKLLEKNITTNDVVITGKKSISTPIINEKFNEYTVEMKTAERIPATYDDPNRAINSSASTITVNDFYNNIIVRGNKPSNLIYKIDGLEIPNPNHFLNRNGESGSIAMVHNDALKSVSLSTLGFDATHGNAIAGVFSLNLKDAYSVKNKNKVQVGLLGVNALSEGSLIKGGKSSYLVRYRYATLGILSKLGLKYNDSPFPTYQDAQFTFNLYHYLLKDFKIWFIGGQNTLIENKGSINTIDNKLGIIGLSFNYDWAEKTKINYSMMASTSKNTETNESQFYKTVYQNQYNESILRLQLVFKTLLNSKLSYRWGITQSNINIQSPSDTVNTTHYITQYFISGNYFPTKRIKIEIGCHAIHSSIIELSKRIKGFYEPRFKFDLTLNKNWSINLTAGHYSKLDNYIVYKYYPNLDYSKSFNYTFGINKKLTPTINFKVEMYYQNQYQVPVCITNGFEGYSFINGTTTSSALDFVPNGKGINQGIEFLFEKSYTDNWFGSISGSVFDSKYSVNDGSWYNSRFDLGYNANILFGKTLEFKKSRSLSLSFKYSVSGGQYLPEIDQKKSSPVSGNVYVKGIYLTQQASEYSKFDLQLAYSKQYKKNKMDWQIDIMNLFNRRNMLSQFYNMKTNQIENQYMLGIIPTISCKLTF